MNGFGKQGDYSYVSGEEYIPGWSPARWWRNKQQRYGLVGEVCPHCEHKIFPPRDVCPYCGDEARSTIQAVALDETGDTTRALAMRNQVSE